jgi:type IV secretion system protein TrbL
MGAASMAAGAASVAGAAVMGGAASAAGGMSAIKAAFEKAGSSAGGESGGMPMLGGGAGGDSDAGSFAQAAGVGGGGSSAGTSTPLGQAAGFYSSGSSSSSGSSGQSKVAQQASPAGSSGSGSSSKASEGGDAGGQAGQAGQGAGSLLAATAANLAKGIGDVAKAKAASIRNAAAERIADTTGGKIAAAIRASSQTDQAAEDVPSFGGNSLVELIGLGSGARVAEVEVTWPTSRTTQRFRHIPSDRTIELTEGSDVIRTPGNGSEREHDK